MNYMTQITNEEISEKLYYELIPKKQIKDVFANNYYACAELLPSFMGFVKTYYNLSELIPTDFTIIDIGASYNPQCFLFKDHKKVISISPGFKDTEPLFQSPNCDIYRVTCGEFIRNILPTLDLDLSKTFVICNYVPNWFNENPSELIRKHFNNIYIFYPSH